MCSKDKINIAVIGCGMLAQSMHLPNIVSNPRFNLKWCCDRDENILHAVNEMFKPEKVTTDAHRVAADKDCFAVVICTHHNVRKELITLFACAGKHIYAEKPLANDLNEVKEIYKIVKKNKITFCLGHNRRCAPAIKEARRIYLKHKANPVNPAWRYNREGLNGPDNEWNKRTLVLIRVNDDALSWKKWAFAEGLVYVEMTHFVDLACYITDLKPSWVSIAGDPTTNYSVGTINIEFEDRSLASIVTTANGTFGYPKELIEVYYGGAAIAVDHCVELRVAGIKDEPFWRTYPLENDEYLHIHTDGGIKDYYHKTLMGQKETLMGIKKICMPPSPDKGHRRMLDEFIDAALAGKSGPSDIESSE